jgi:hypothetical protein
VPSPVYLARLEIKGLGKVFDGPLIGVKTNDPQCPILIGRDFLSSLVMIYEGSGRVALCD